MIHAKHPLAKFKALPFRRSFMQVPPATSCLAIHFVCIPGQEGGEQLINVLFNDFLSPAFSLTLSKGKENSRRNCPKVFSPVAHGVIAQTRNVFVPTLSVVFPNSWAVREQSVHHHAQHLSQAWRGTPQVHQPPLVSMIPVWVQGSHKKICQPEHREHIKWKLHVPTGYDYTSRSAPYLLHVVQIINMTLCGITMPEVSQGDVHLEHLYPNPLRRLPSAILCEHHVQKPPAELLLLQSWATRKPTTSHTSH